METVDNPTPEVTAPAATPKTPKAPAEAKTWQARLAVEAKDLKGNILKLQDFFANPDWLKVEPAQQELMKRQYTFMELYLGVLEERLALVKQAEAKE
jgi:hypothetical protein